MELENRTPYPAALFRGVIDDERLCAAVVARLTYELGSAGLQPSAEQSWPVEGGPRETEYGMMPGDELFYRGGVDLFVFGSAQAPEGRPAGSVDVVVEIDGRVQHRIVAFGERRWERRGNELVASPPEPFTALPLTLEHAFGGADEWDKLPLPYSDNPEGTGYYVEQTSAVGGPLPRLEDPAALVRSWQDRPEPTGVGLTPQFFGPRLRRAVEIDESTGRVTRFDATFFNTAFPAMVVARDALHGGTSLRIWGVQPHGPVELRLPPVPLMARLRFGAQVTEVPLQIDQVGIEVEQRRAFITYRYPFRYRLIPYQLRGCELCDAPLARRS